METIIALHPELLVTEAAAMVRRIGGRFIWLGGHLIITSGATPCAH